MTEISGFMYFNKANKNGRVYQSDASKDAVQEYKEKVDKGVSFSELEHPSSFDVSMNRVTHKITAVKQVQAKLPRKAKKRFIKNRSRFEYKNWCMMNGGLKTTAIFLDTELGRMARGMRDALTLSARGVGTIGKDGLVQNYKLLTFDLINKQENAFKRNR